MHTGPLHIGQFIEATNAGVARHVFDLVEELAEQGHRIELFYSRLRLDGMNRSRLEAFQHWEGVRCHPCDMRRGPHPSDMKVVRSLWKQLRQVDSLDLLHGHSTKGGAIARLVGKKLGLPVVYTPNAVRSMDPALPGWAKHLIVRIERFLSRRTSHTIAVSPEEEEHLVESIRVPRSRVTVIPNGIHPFPLAESEVVREELGLPREGTVLGFVGRLGWQKGPDLLVEALPSVLERLPEVRVAMVGDGDMRSKLEARVAELGLQARVRFLGFRDGQRAMPAFDAFVLPSRYEGLPYVLVEAMYAGLPIIASDQTGCRLLVESGKNGCVYPYADREALASAMVEVLSDRDRRVRMGEESKRRAQAFSAESMSEQTLAVYRRVLADHRGTRHAGR